jgi:hypothetical protein
MDTKDIVALTILFLAGFYLYALPLAESQFPFGEGDAAHKYGLADWMYDADKAPRDMPFFYAVWYPQGADFYRPPNPAPYFINIVATRLAGGGDRFTAANLFLAISAYFAVFSVYFLMRKFYGFWTALLSSLLLLFPLNSVMAYLWGQRPHLIALAYAPLIFYCFHRYCSSILDNRPRPIYLILAALLSVGAAVMYLQVIGFIFVFFVLYIIVLMVQTRKLPLKLKHLLLPPVVFVLLAGPFIPDVLSQQQGKIHIQLQNLNHLFHWFKPEADVPNPFLYDYKTINGGWWTLPFLLLGIAFLLFRHRREDIVFLAWLAALYIMLHLDVFNLFDQGRTARLFLGTAQIFYAIAAFGFLAILSFISLGKQQKAVARYALVAVFIVLALVFNAPPAVSSIKEAYQPLMRMTPYQFEAAQWLENNIPDNSLVYMRGSLTYAKARWIHMFSHKPVMPGNSREVQTLEEEIRLFKETEDNVKSFPSVSYISYLVFDYSDYSILRDNAGNNQMLKQQANQEIENINKLESYLTRNATPIYDRNFIKVYKLGNS